MAKCASEEYVKIATLAHKAYSSIYSAHTYVYAYIFETKAFHRSFEAELVLHFFSVFFMEFDKYAYSLNFVHHCTFQKIKVICHSYVVRFSFASVVMSVDILHFQFLRFLCINPLLHVYTTFTTYSFGVFGNISQNC